MQGLGRPVGLVAFESSHQLGAFLSHSANANATRRKLHSTSNRKPSKIPVLMQGSGRPVGLVALGRGRHPGAVLEQQPPPQQHVHVVAARAEGGAIRGATDGSPAQTAAAHRRPRYGTYAVCIDAAAKHTKRDFAKAHELSLGQLL
jgi:hypothetical protein